MRHSHIILALVLTLSVSLFAVSPSNVEKADRFRSDCSIVQLDEQINVANTANEAISNDYNYLLQKSSAQISELGSRFGWAISNSQISELGSRFGWAISNSQISELGSRFGWAISNSQISELGSRFGWAISNSQISELGSRFGWAISNSQISELGSRFGWAI